MAKTYRAAVIGATQRGNYGHGHDTVFKDLDRVEYVAIADANPEGLKKTGAKAGITNLYADYREMLAKEKPDLVAIGPRWVDQRVDMVEAACDAGCHIYIEKPLAGSLADADRVLDACKRAGVKMAVAHQNRSFPPAREILARLRAGEFGKLVRMRARGKEDRRGGGEDLIVLGTHMLDLMTMFAGPVRWISAYVGVGDRPATVADARRPSEPVGPVAGDSLTATYGFDNGVLGFFDSRANVARSGRSPFSIVLECEQASIAIRRGEVAIYPSSCVVPENPEFSWEKLWVEDWHYTPEHKLRPTGDMLHRGNRILVADLIDAIEQNRKPASSGADARLALEMIQGVYASHLAGGARLPIPLQQREHPLGSLD